MTISDVTCNFLCSIANVFFLGWDFFHEPSSHSEMQIKGLIFNNKHKIQVRRYYMH